jgi:hypothetical protein
MVTCQIKLPLLRDISDNMLKKFSVIKKLLQKILGLELNKNIFYLLDKELLIDGH